METVENHKIVYLICENNYIVEVVGLRQQLKNCGLDVVLLESNNSETLLETHWNILNSCDSCVIYYSSGKENWLKSKVYDIIKSPGLGRLKPNTSNVVVNKSGKQISFGLLEKMNMVNMIVMPELSDEDIKNVLIQKK